jgi:hypothetical protein
VKPTFARGAAVALNKSGKGSVQIVK